MKTRLSLLHPRGPLFLFRARVCPFCPLASCPTSPLLSLLAPVLIGLVFTLVLFFARSLSVSAYTNIPGLFVPSHPHVHPFLIHVQRSARPLRQQQPLGKRSRDSGRGDETAGLTRGTIRTRRAPALRDHTRNHQGCTQWRAAMFRSTAREGRALRHSPSRREGWWSGADPRTPGLRSVRAASPVWCSLLGDG